MSQPFKIAAFVVFAAFPLLEIGLLIRVGELIGVHVIPRPAEDLEKVFPMLRPKP